IKAFISCLLAYDPNHKNLTGGILGVTKGYYGCVEAQGRGTLHCHTMVWLEGALNPNEIKHKVVNDADSDFRNRLIAFLDDSISNSLPPESMNLPAHESVPESTLLNFHPCATQGPPVHAESESYPYTPDSYIQQDLHNLVKTCQVHRHTKTCYKYWKGPPSPKECHFDMDASNFCPETSIDMETGEICFRCLDGLVNNFNETIIQAVRCNMDIKFIGSGPSAKAVTYYITNYITKSELKTHVAFAALELSVKKLGVYNPDDDELTVRAKQLLQKCAYAMISHQELSAQQVASYLMDYEDHYSSHKCRNLYWSLFEAITNKQIPSPECY
ncbi:hypothetical protein BJ165DRAFT_1308189, partial [Panaeolus papilionaceus]